jgi:hypothetical protein
MEAQPEWAAPAEELPALEAQPEWATPAEELPALEAQPEWAAPAEELPALEAQPEWATPAEPAAIELQPEWAPEEPAATPEPQADWNAPVEEVQPEWMTAEATPAQPTAEPEQSWSPASTGSVQGDWNESAEPTEEIGAIRDTSAFGTSTAWASEPEPEPEASWSSEPQAPAWSADASAFGQVEDLSGGEPTPELPPLASEAATELPIMEFEPEMPEIDVSEDVVEELPATPPPPPMASRLPEAVAAPVAVPPPPPAAMMTARAVAPRPLAPEAVLSAPANAFIEGEHRVIIHTVEGQVKRGTLRDVDLLDETIPLEQQTGFAPENIPVKRVKAIFFMLPPTGRQPQPEGQKIRITFNDGRQVAGFSNDYKNTRPGFFVVPADNRTNTERIFIYRSSVQAVAEG